MKKKILIFSILAISARLSGFIREISVLYSYGTSVEADVFFIVTSIPLVFFMGFSLLYSNVFIKYFSIHRSVLVAATAVITIIGVIVSSIIIFFSSDVLSIFAPGFNQNTLIEGSKALKIAGGYIILIALVNLFSSILNYLNRPYRPLLSNMFNTIVVIMGVLISDQLGNYYLIFISLLVGYFIQLLYLIISVFKISDFSANLSIQFKDIKIAFSILKSSAWLFLGYFTQQLTGVIERAIASGLFIGAVSIMNYANKIHGFLIGIMALGVSNIAYPFLLKKSKVVQIEIFTKLVGKVGYLTILLFILTVNLVNILVNNEFLTNLFGDNKQIIEVLLLLLSLSPFLIMREILNYFSMIFNKEKTTSLTSFMNLLVYIILVLWVNVYHIKELVIIYIISNVISTMLLVLMLNRELEVLNYKKNIVLSLLVMCVGIISPICIMFSHTLISTIVIVIVAGVILFLDRRV